MDRAQNPVAGSPRRVIPLCACPARSFHPVRHQTDVTCRTSGPPATANPHEHDSPGFIIHIYRPHHHYSYHMSNTWCAHTNTILRGLLYIFSDLTITTHIDISVWESGDGAISTVQLTSGNTITYIPYHEATQRSGGNPQQRTFHR